MTGRLDQAPLFLKAVVIIHRIHFRIMELSAAHLKNKHLEINELKNGRGIEIHGIQQ